MEIKLEAIKETLEKIEGLTILKKDADKIMFASLKAVYDVRSTPSGRAFMSVYGLTVFFETLQLSCGNINLLDGDGLLLAIIIL